MSRKEDIKTATILATGTGEIDSRSADTGLPSARAAATGEGAVLIDATGVVIGVDPIARDLLGYAGAEGDLLGGPASRLLADEAAELSGLLGFEPGTDAEGSHRHMVVLQRRDGLALVTETQVNVLTANGGKAYLLLVRDVDFEDEESWNDDESRLAGFTSNIPGIVFQRVMQPDGAIYYPFFSAGLTEILGFSADAIRLTQDGCLDFVHWADRDDLMKALRRSALDLRPFHEEFRAITRDGEVRWLAGNSSPKSMPNGDVMWDGVLLDITERRHVEQRLEMVMDHAYDSVITIGEDGIIESANAAAERLFGHKVGDLVGRNVALLMPEPFRSAHDGYLRRYVETGESRILGRGPVELTGMRADGSTFPLEMALSEIRLEGRRIFISITRDITQRKQTEARLRETEQRLIGIASNVPGMVFQRVMRNDGSVRFTYVSEGCRDLLGVAPQDLIDDFSVFLDMLSSDDRQRHVASLKQSATTLESLHTELPYRTKKGETHWLTGYSKPRRLETGEVLWDGLMLDTTDRKKAEERLTFLAYFDPVTGLPNREMFSQRFDRAKRFAERAHAPVGVLSLGLDRFGIINATMGHTIGDHVLRAAAERLQDCLNKTDTVARASGDRFLILLSSLAADVEIVEIVDTVLRHFHEPLIVDGHEIDITVSIGAALYPRDGEEVETLIRNADAALHRAKGQGPGSVQVFTAEMSAAAAGMLSMQNRIRHAIENREFVAYYQPQVDLKTGLIIGTEALARWIDKETGRVVPPGEFIGVAEEFGLIDAIAEQVTMDACRTNKRWQDEGLATIPVAVNVSGRQFHNARRLMNLVDQVMAETGINPRYVELELTESSAMSDPENAIGVVRSLRERGLFCAIDDFGTGYSSLSVLKRFPIRKIKIDRSFVSDVITDQNDAAIVGAIIAMARSLKLKVIAEGVEETEHYEFLRKLGCDQIQGYLVSPPLPAERIEAFFRDGAWKPYVETPFRPALHP